MKKDHKPVIETIINTTALALTAYGVTHITTGGDGFHLDGYLAILIGMGLEFLKYLGRAKELW